MNYTKFSYQGLNFACNNLPDACIVEITNHPEKQKIDNIILLLVNQNLLMYCPFEKILAPHLHWPPKLISLLPNVDIPFFEFDFLYLIQLLQITPAKESSSLFEELYCNMCQ